MLFFIIALGLFGISAAILSVVLALKYNRNQACKTDDKTTEVAQIPSADDEFETPFEDSMESFESPFRERHGAFSGNRSDEDLADDAFARAIQEKNDRKAVGKTDLDLQEQADADASRGAHDATEFYTAGVCAEKLALSDWMSQEHQSEIMDFTSWDDRLMIVYDDHSFVDPIVVLESDCVRQDRRYVLMNGTRIASVDNAQDLTLDHIVLVGQSVLEGRIAA